MENDIVFISYAREDVRQAERLYMDLRLHKLNVWLDSKCLKPGQEWNHEIRKAIKSAKYFIALLSKHSLSKRGYIQKEIKLALNVLDEIPKGEIFFIPARLEEIVPEDEELQNLNWLDIYPSYKDGLARILSVCKELEKKELDYLDPGLPIGERAPISFYPYKSFGEFVHDFISKFAHTSVVADRSYQLFISFYTKFPGTILPKYLLQEYPESIKIVLHHQYTNLIPEKDKFTVTLWFGSKQETLTIIYDSIIEISIPHLGLIINHDKDIQNA